MKIFRSKPAVALASAAALAMTATPAMARGWHRHHDRGLDAGDVFAGILIIGGIAAVASAASKANREKREARYPDARYPDRRYPSDEDYRDYRDYRDRSGRYGEPPAGQSSYGGSGWRGSTGMDAAVDTCVGEVERGRDRVESVDSVNRAGEGWRVEGRVENGREFGCSVDGNGRVSRVTVDGRAVI